MLCRTHWEVSQSFHKGAMILKLYFQFQFFILWLKSTRFPLLDFNHKIHLKKKGSVRVDLLTGSWRAVSYTKVECLSRPSLGSITFPFLFHHPGFSTVLEKILQRTISFVFLLVNNGSFGCPVCEFWGRSQECLLFSFCGPRYPLAVISVWIHIVLIFRFQKHHCGALR